MAPVEAVGLGMPTLLLGKLQLVLANAAVISGGHGGAGFGGCVLAFRWPGGLESLLLDIASTNGFGVVGGVDVPLA